MQFRQGVSVRMADGKTVGQLDRVVVDPRTKEVNYIVVRKGTFFTTDRVVPLTLVAQADENEVALREDAGNLENLPQFEERHYVASDSGALSAMSAPSLYAYPPLLGGEITGMTGTLPTWATLGGISAREPVVEQAQRAIPDDNVALRAGARVVAADGETVGSVDEVLTGANADQVSHFVISQGLLFKDRKLIPIGWTQEIGEDQVTLAVDSAFVSRLESYQGAR